MLGVWKLHNSLMVRNVFIDSSLLKSLRSDLHEKLVRTWVLHQSGTWGGGQISSDQKKGSESLTVVVAVCRLNIFRMMLNDWWNNGNHNTSASIRVMMRVLQTYWRIDHPPCTSPSCTFSSSCRCWEGLRLVVSLMCVGLCAIQRGDPVGSSMPVSRQLPTWRRWCKLKWTPQGSPVETRLKDSVHWSVALSISHLYVYIKLKQACQVLEMKRIGEGRFVINGKEAAESGACSSIVGSLSSLYWEASTVNVDQSSQVGLWTPTCSDWEKNQNPGFGGL